MGRSDRMSHVPGSRWKDAGAHSVTARTVPLRAFQITPLKEYPSVSSYVHNQSPQAVRHIHNRDGKHCGLWWEQASYGYVGEGMSAEAESKIGMLEISRYAGNAYSYRPRKELYGVEGEIEKFDDKAFPVVGPESGLVNVLVVDLDTWIWAIRMGLVIAVPWL